MDISKAPLYKALIDFKNKKPTSFHVPGHKNGEVFPKQAIDTFQSLLQIDFTELTGLDDLHDPTNIIKEAQELLAQYYQAKSSYFLVNGSTVGNLSMLHAAVKYGEQILVQRNCHKSVIYALQLIGANPIFLMPEIDDHTNTPAGINIQTIKEAIVKYPNAKAICLTNPSYYGISQNLEDIVKLAHNHNMPVLVDEAHGAHFILGKPFPKSSLEYGADIVVQSAHKTLPAMTMGSFLHVHQNSLIHEDRVSHYLKGFQSSSPSYPIMASLDLARYYIQQLSERDLNDILATLEELKNQISKIPGIKVVSKTSLQDYAIDPLKIVLQLENGYSGFAFQKRLEEEQIYTELADPKNVLFVMPLAKQQNIELVIKKITSAIKGLEETDREVSLNDNKLNTLKWVSELSLSYREMAEKRIKVVPIKNAVHQVAAETVIPYPPGIPIIMAGEKITEQQVHQMYSWERAGARFQGKENIDFIKVFDD